MTEFNNTYDTMIAEYALDAGVTALSLKDLSEHKFGIEVIRYEELLKEFKTKTLADIPKEKIKSYAGQDALLTLMLYHEQQKSFDEQPKAARLYDNIERPLTQLLLKMERNGVAIDTAHLHKLSRELDNDMSGLFKEMCTINDGVFNPNSPLQLREIL